MELVIFVGIQATGKSTFFARKFFDTHVRINLDMLKTKQREHLLFQACLQADQSCVIDKTNLTPKSRRRYIEQGQIYDAFVVGYYFQSKVSDALSRNRKRKRFVPEKGILGAYSQLILPKQEEGFDELFYVRQSNDNFEVTPWDPSLEKR